MSSISALAGPQLHHVADGIEVIERPQRHFRLGDVLVELAIDAETADLAEPIAVGVLELLAEQLLGLLQLRRIAGTQPLVNLQQRFLVRRRRIVVERGDDQRILDLADQHFLDRAGVNSVDVLLG